MVVNSKIRESDWLTFTLTIVNFNYVFIQPAPDNTISRGGWEGEGDIMLTCLETSFTFPVCNCGETCIQALLQSNLTSHVIFEPEDCSGEGLT